MHSKSSWDTGSFVKMYLIKISLNVGFRPFFKVKSYFLNQVLGSSDFSWGKTPPETLSAGHSGEYKRVSRAMGQ